MADEQNYFFRWWSSPTIGSDLKVIWEMSVMAIRKPADLDEKYAWEADQVTFWVDGIAIDLKTGKPLDPQPDEEPPKV